LPDPQRITIDSRGLSSTPAAPPRGPDGSLKVTRDDQANAIRQQIDEAWRSRDFDKVEHLLKAYSAVAREEPEDLRGLREALSAERHLAETSRACESASAKIQSRAFSTAVAELDALPVVPKAPTPDYEARLSEASKQVQQIKRAAVDKWVLSVRNDVWRLCQDDKESYGRVDTALDELNRIPLSEENRTTTREQISTEARRTRTACIEKQIEQAVASSKWTAVIDLCGELASVDPGSVSARTHHDDATRHLQEELADEIASAWTKRDLDATQSLLQRYAEQWQELPEELQHVQRCHDMERFLANGLSSHCAAEAKAKRKDYPRAVVILDAIPKHPAPPDDSYTAQLTALMGKVAKLRQEAIAGWIEAIEGKVRGRCRGTAQDFRRVDFVVAETWKIPLDKDAKTRLQETLRKEAARERSRALDAKLKAACDQRDWPLVLSLCDELEVLEPESKMARKRRRQAEDGKRLSAGVLKAVYAFSQGRFVKCAILCDKLAKEHSAGDRRFKARAFEGSLPQLREAARKKEAEFLAAIDSLQKASDSNDWHGVAHWAEAARKLKPKDSKVQILVKESDKKRAQIKRRDAFRAFRRMAALAALCVSSLFVSHYLRQRRSFDGALSEGDETAAFEAAQRVKWFYGPAERFLSARDEYALLKSARKAAEDITGHAHDGNWSIAEQAFSDGHKAWESREFSAAEVKWSTARTHYQRVVSAAVRLTISVSPDIPDALVRLTSAQNEELSAKRGSVLSLRATPAQYRVQVTHPNYEPHEKELDVSPDKETLSVSAKLTRLPGTLLVWCEPTADILEDGNIIGKTGQPVVLPAGDHDIEVAAEHYESVSQTVSLAPIEIANLDVALNPLPRRLLVTCDPVASVFVDGREIGRTDEDLIIPVGEYELTLVADGYWSKSLAVEVRPGHDVKLDVTFELIPLPGKLRLSCRPTAQVFADGELVGTTDEPILLTEGTHRVELVADGFLKKAFTVRIPLGQDVEWTGSLDRIPGTLRVEATIPAEYGKPKFAPAAELTIGGIRKTATLPHNETGLAPGDYKIQLDVQGYEPMQQRTVTIVSEETTRMFITIVPLPATVRFVTHPQDADVYVKTWTRGVGATVKIGRGGQTSKLMPFIEHELTFKAKGYDTRRKRLCLPHPGRHHGDVRITLFKRYEWR